MKLTTLLLIMALVQASARGYSQKISLNETNASLEKVISTIKQQSGYVFLYTDQELKNEKITVKVNNAGIDEALRACFKNTPVEYKIVGDNILLKKNEPSLIDKGKSLFAKITITGNVRDQAGPLVGAIVRLKGSSIGVSTNINGDYSITVPDTSQRLTFSYVGFKTQEIAIAGRSSISVTLAPEIGNLEEVIVQGYGSTTKKDLTGSVAQINVADLQKAPVISFDQAVAGRVAGVRVESKDGQPGNEGLSIVIRGANSLSQSNSPLYVIDGFPIEDPENMSLNPEDIKTMNILKDASATAIYGARGANGVVVIETKHGQAGSPAISFNTSLGFQKVTKLIPTMNAYDFVRYQYERDPDLATTYYLQDSLNVEDYKNVPGIDWQSKLFHKATMQTYNLAIRGGNDKTKYAISGSLADQGGVIINSGLNRYQGRFVLDQTISSKITTGINVNYSSYGNYGSIASAANAGTGASSYLLYSVWGSRPVKSSSLIENNDLEESLLDDDIDETMDYRVNPILDVENELRKSVSNNIIANGYFTYDIIPGLKLRVTGGFENLNRKNLSFYNSQTSKGTPLFPNNTRGQYGSVGFIGRSNWLNENTLTWTKRLNKDNKVDILGGFTMQGTSTESYGFLSQNVPNESLSIYGLDQGVPTSTTSSGSDNKLSSFLARANYSFKSRYLFTASIRADGSSKFSPENRWAYFPSAAFAWRVKDEGFMQNMGFISEAKFRTSYGVTGNNRVSDFATLPALTSPISASYSFNNGIPSTAVVQTSLGNTALKWESTAQVDLGIDLGFLKDRISLTADVYRKTTYNLLLNADLPTTTGFTSVYKNIGKVRNEGLEITLETVNVRSRNFTWQSNFNISFTNNKVLELSENQDNMLSTVAWGTSFNTVPLYIAALNSPAAMFYGYLSDGLYQIKDFDVVNGTYSLKLSEPTNGLARYRIQPGDIRYKDVNLDGVVDDRDRVVIGRVLPIHTGGFNNDFRYKGFDLNVFFQWSYGNKVYNANRMQFEGNVNNVANLNQYASYNNRWTLENQNSTMFRTGGFGPTGYYSDYFLEDGSFLRLKTVSLGYSIPSKVLKSTFIKNASISVSAQNLFTWTKYDGMDPEVSVRNSTLTPGFDYSAYPIARTLVFSIRTNL